MNRRELFAVGGAGVVGLLFPRKLEAESVEPMLRGLTDLSMAQKIAEFPQSSESAILPDYDCREDGCELRDYNIIGIRRSNWYVEVGGTIIYGHWSKKSFGDKWSKKSFGRIEDKWNTDFTMDVKDLSFIRFRQANPIPSNIYNNMTEYRRLAVDGGSGWFMLQDGT